MPPTLESLYILGAGFSHNAGLPLQGDFTDAILEGRGFHRIGPSKTLTQFLSAFVTDVFGRRMTDVGSVWPYLEDLFTCVDLSANTGHHLGRYSPAELRTVRRALISRIIRMLRQRYKPGSKTNGEWDPLSSLITSVDYRRSAFLTLNWDTVLEDRLSELVPKIAIDYGQGILLHELDGTDRVLEARQERPPVQIVKMHGSINWLYCDNCRQTFAYPTKWCNHIAAQLLSPQDWERIDKTLKEHRILPKPIKSRHTPKSICNKCTGVALSTRLATFSYRKALDFPMFQQSWSLAERLLREANKWIFIGYSLPAADFEFKHLLKRVGDIPSGRSRSTADLRGRRDVANKGQLRALFWVKIKEYNHL